MHSTSLPPRLREAAATSASPEDVETLLVTLLETDPNFTARADEHPHLIDAVVAVAGASRSLGRLLASDPSALTVLENLDLREPPPRDEELLAPWKRRELLRIAARDLLGIDDLVETTAALSQMARDVLQAATELARADGLAVIAMGKFGGDELNYASDVDVIFVGDGDHDTLQQAARRVLAVAGRCFRVDVDLRPEGRAGALVRSLDSYETYWARWAEPWEFQALLKARYAAGEPSLGRRFVETAQRWLWTHPPDAEAIRYLRSMKRRSERFVDEKGLLDSDIKRGRGGIRDIEFTVQLLQLVHGHADPSLRAANTLTVLDELGKAGYIDEEDARVLETSYRFLRRTEHAIQLLDEQQTHTIPSDPGVLERIARTLGYKDTPEGRAAQLLDADLKHTQVSVRVVHERVFFRPLLEAFAGADGGMSPETASERLSAFGFTDAERTRIAVRELTHGLNRASRLMRHLLPLLLDWLSQSPDPDLGLLQLRNLLAGPRTNQRLLDAFRDSPEIARRLCTLLGSSRMVGDGLLRNPDVVSRLAHEERLLTKPRPALVESARTALGWRATSDRQAGLRRWKERNLLGIVCRDLLGLLDVAGVGEELATLAEATVEAALEVAAPDVPFAVVALGRLGGRELSYASDLDLVFVHGGTSAEAFEKADRLARSVMRFLSGGTAAERIFEVDPDLRPEGRKGPMSRSLDGYASYFSRWAETWERQAWTRARFVAGDAELGESLVAAARDFSFGRPLESSEIREIRRIKARVESERIPPSEDPEFHLKLGRGGLADVEWVVQLLQLRHGVVETSTLEALRELESRGIVDSEDATILRESYEFCESCRNRIALVVGPPANSLPSGADLDRVARSFQMTASELRERYKRTTRRARRVYERLFFGNS
ncbi:MAG: glutamate-ammonia-ligase adenylyltransferase [Acidimicrobiales bacterium]|nr:MAG: glutamate-ammonia-ligase adenylyltransferase [Acidimicrobiales bacterium]